MSIASKRQNAVHYVEHTYWCRLWPAGRFLYGVSFWVGWTLVCMSVCPFIALACHSPALSSHLRHMYTSAITCSSSSSTSKLRGRHRHHNQQTTQRRHSWDVAHAQTVPFLQYCTCSLAVTHLNRTDRRTYLWIDSVQHSMWFS